MARDWREPEHRREAFQRFYSFHLRHRAHPGLVYFWLPDIAEAYGLDEDGRAWLTWLNGNTQNPVTSLLLLNAAPSARHWRSAVDFWNDNFKQLEWDTDRRHQKSRFGEATEQWVRGGYNLSDGWLSAGLLGWKATWDYAVGQPYMGRLSAWSMTEYARILLGDAVPDSADLMLGDLSGSNSHRNGLCVVDGLDAAFWKPKDRELYPSVPYLTELGASLLEEARRRNPDNPDVGYLTLESALCTYKSWHKPNRRYPGVYADMAYYRLRKAEERWGRRFALLWESRARHLPRYLRLEDNPFDPGLVPDKQNQYLNTGQIPVLYHEWSDMLPTNFDIDVTTGAYGRRKD